MKEDKSIFLKVDGVEPVYKAGFGICSRGTYLDGIKVWIGGDGHFFECDQYIVCEPPDAVREAGHREVFALMKKIYNMTGTERQEAFGDVFFGEIVKDASYDDLMKKLDAWKKEKEIRVRDEVCYKAFNERFVITKIYTPCDGDTIVNGLKKDGTAIKGLLLCNVEKTGVHVDNIDSYLEV